MVIGIDLGTTHVSVALAEPDSAVRDLPIVQRVDRNERRAEPLLPSFLYIPTEPEAQGDKYVVGKWAQEIKTEQGLTIKGTTSYKQDGTFAGDATLSLGGQNIRIAIEGTWKVADGVIAETIEKSNFQGVPQGHVSKDTVLSISQKTLERKDEQGKRSVQTRVGN